MADRKVNQRFDPAAYLESLKHLPLGEQREQLKRKRGELEQELVTIRAQIVRAQAEAAEGKPVDPQWLVRLNGARRAKGWQIQQITAATGTITRQMAAQERPRPRRVIARDLSRDFARCFMIAARRRLSWTLYQELLEETHALAAAGEGSPYWRGRIYYEDENHAKHLLGSFEVQAHNCREAERLAMDEFWDERLTSASCAPCFEFDAMENPDDEEPTAEELAEVAGG